MDVQIQELLDTIKRDGVESAERQAKEIIAEAQSRADATIATAENAAKDRISQAEREIAQMELSGKSALTQAARDVLLTLRASIEKTLTAAVYETVKQRFDGPVLEQAIIAVAANLSGGAADIVLPAGTEQQVVSSLKAKLAEQLKTGLDIKVSPAVASGFRLQEKDGSAYFDLTVDAVAEMLAGFVNPKFVDVLKSAAGQA